MNGLHIVHTCERSVLTTIRQSVRVFQDHTRVKNAAGKAQMLVGQKENTSSTQRQL